MSDRHTEHHGQSPWSRADWGCGLGNISPLLAFDAPSFLHPQFELIFAVEPVNLLAVHHHILQAQATVKPLVTPARPVMGEFLQTIPQQRVVTSTRTIA